MTRAAAAAGFVIRSWVSVFINCSISCVGSGKSRRTCTCNGHKHQACRGYHCRCTSTLHTHRLVLHHPELLWLHWWWLQHTPHIKPQPIIAILCQPQHRPCCRPIKFPCKQTTPMIQRYVCIIHRRHQRPWLLLVSRHPGVHLPLLLFSPGVLSPPLSCSNCDCSSAGRGGGGGGCCGHVAGVLYWGGGAPLAKKAVGRVHCLSSTTWCAWVCFMRGGEDQGVEVTGVTSQCPGA